MLRAAIAFFILALIALALGASGFAGFSMEIGKVLLYTFLVLAIISLIVGLFSSRGKGPNVLP